MIIIAQPYARYQETLAISELEPAATRLLQVAEDVCRQYFAQRYNQLGIMIETRLEVGSTRTWTTIMALTATLIFYGDIRQGADYLVKDAKMLSRLILPKVASTVGLQPSQPERHERRLGVPGELRRLFERVERGDMSADEATSRALHLLPSSDDTDTARELPRLKQKLMAELKAAARFQHDEAQPTKTTPIVKATEAAPKERPELPKRPEMALPPTTPIQRRRGVIASMDPKTGHVTIRGY
jgi:hypothetical protein